MREGYRGNQKKLPPIPREGVEAHADVQGKGEKGDGYTYRDGKILQYHRGGGSVDPNMTPPPSPHFQLLSAARVEQGELSSVEPSGRVRGGQSFRSQASDTSQFCWSTLDGWPISGPLLMVAGDINTKLSRRVSIRRRR